MGRSKEAPSIPQAATDAALAWAEQGASPLPEKADPRYVALVKTGYDAARTAYAQGVATDTQKRILSLTDQD